MIASQIPRLKKLAASTTGFGLRFSAEKNSHAKGDDCSETDPPRKFDGRQPIRPCVGDPTEDSSNRVEEIADDCDDDESDNHGDDVADVAATTSGKHSTKKNTEDGPISVGEDAEDNRNDAKIRVDNDEIGSDRGNDDHKD